MEKIELLRREISILDYELYKLSFSIKKGLYSKEYIEKKKLILEKFKDFDFTTLKEKVSDERESFTNLRFFAIIATHDEDRALPFIPYVKKWLLYVRSFRNLQFFLNELEKCSKKARVEVLKLLSLEQIETTLNYDLAQDPDHFFRLVKDRLNYYPWNKRVKNATDIAKVIANLMNNEPSLGKMTGFYLQKEYAEFDFMKQVTDMLDLNSLKEKIIREQNGYTPCWIISKLTIYNKKFGFGLAPLIAEKINQTTNVKILSHCISLIFSTINDRLVWINKDFKKIQRIIARKIDVNSISETINNSNEVEDVFFILGFELHYIKNKRIRREIFNRIDFQKVFTDIKNNPVEEHNYTEAIFRILEIVSEVDTRLLKKLLKESNFEFTKLINQSTKLADALSCLKPFYRIPKYAKRHILPKLNLEKHVENFKRVHFSKQNLRYVSQSDYAGEKYYIVFSLLARANKLVSNYIINLVGENYIIDFSNHCIEIDKFSVPTVSYIHNPKANKNQINRIFKSINTEKIVSKINESEDHPRILSWLNLLVKIKKLHKRTFNRLKKSLDLGKIEEMFKEPTPYYSFSHFLTLLQLDKKTFIKVVDTLDTEDIAKYIAARTDHAIYRPISYVMYHLNVMSKEHPTFSADLDRKLKLAYENERKDRIEIRKEMIK